MNAAKNAKSAKTKVIEVRYGNALIRIYPRANGMVAVAWREDGRQRRTTRADLEEAKEWARQKAKRMDQAVGGRWLPVARAERLEWLERLAGGPEEVGRLLADVEAARRLLGPAGRLEEAARWFLAHGPPVAGRRTLAEAVAAFVAEYEEHHPSATTRSFKAELLALVRSHGELDLLEVSPALLSEHVRRGKVADRTVWNRVASWVTFFNRCAALQWWPEGRKNPASVVKRPPKAGAGAVAPAVFSPEEGRAVLEVVERDMPQFLSFVLIAGWLGCRPSECQRLRWSDFDWKNRTLHVRAEVARKVRRERWIPVPVTVAARLRRIQRREEALPHYLRGADGMVCRKNAREFVSAHVRKNGTVPGWPQDVLRHSFITYRLQVLRNVDAVAEEAGNSPKEIRQSYKRPVPPGTAERWFAAARR